MNKDIALSPVKAATPHGRNPIAEQHRTLTLLLPAVAYMGLIVLWSLQIPFNAAPDEAAHYFFPEYLIKFHSIPVLTEEVVQFIGPLTHIPHRTDGAWYFAMPFLHLIGAAFTGAIGATFLPASSAFYGIRAFNWLMGGLAAAALVQLAIRGFGPPLYRTAIVLFALSIPQVTFVFAYFNDDAFGFAMSCVLLCLVQEAFFWGKINLKLSVLLSLTIGLLTLAKVYYWPVIVFVAARSIIKLGPREAAALLAGLSLTKAIALLTPALVLALPFHVFNWWHYGDFTGVAVSHRFGELHPERTSQALKICFMFCHGRLLDWALLRPWLFSTFQSFYAVFDYMTVRVPAPFYVAYFAPVSLAIALMILVPCGLGLKASVTKFWSDQILTPLLALGLLTVLLLISIWNSQTYSYQPQGRYLFAIIPVVSAILLSEPVIAGESRSVLITSNMNWIRYRTKVAVLVGVSMIWINLFTLSDVVARTYAERLVRGVQPLAKGVSSVSRSPDSLTVNLHVARGLVGNVELLERTPTGRITVSGWAADSEFDRPADAVFVFAGDRLVAASVPNILRPDVSSWLGLEGLNRSGFLFEFEDPTISDAGLCSLQILVSSMSSGVSPINSVAGCRH
jgi:hypothetical protein